MWKNPLFPKIIRFFRIMMFIKKQEENMLSELLKRRTERELFSLAFLLLLKNETKNYKVLRNLITWLRFIQLLKETSSLLQL